MAFNLEALEEYKRVKDNEVFAASILESELIRNGLFDFQTGIKHKDKLNFIDMNVTIQCDDCDLEAAGTTFFTDKEIAVSVFQSRQDLCHKKLRPYWTNRTLSAGSQNEVSTLQTTIDELHLKKILEKVSAEVWKGNETCNMKGILEWIEEALAGTPALLTPVDDTEFTDQSDILEAIGNLIVAVPAALKGKQLFLVMGKDTETYLRLALLEAYVGNSVIDPKTGQLFIPGFPEITVLAFNGLNGLTENKMFLTTPGNFVIGLDEEDDLSTVESYYEINSQNVVSRIQYKLGTQIKFESEIVISE